MRIFFDSSALAKRYVAEAGTDVVLARCGEADEILVSVICIPEVLSALNRLRRARALSSGDYRVLKRRLAADVGLASVIHLEEGALSRTVECLERAPLRTLDAIQVASAIVSGADLFVSADRRQCLAARALGLRVEEVTP